VDGGDHRHARLLDDVEGVLQPFDVPEACFGGAARILRRRELARGIF
jgi:hypothetical protein